MKIRVLMGFAGYEPGQVFDDWPDGMCEIFIGRGLIEPIAGEAAESTQGTHAADESAEAEQRTERAEIPARRKKAK